MSAVREGDRSDHTGEGNTWTGRVALKDSDGHRTNATSLENTVNGHQQDLKSQATNPL